MILNKRKYPYIGEYKVVTKYAWLPIWVGDKKIWLQKYQLMYEYRTRRRYLSWLRLTVIGTDWDIVGEKVL